MSPGSRCFVNCNGRPLEDRKCGEPDLVSVISFARSGKAASLIRPRHTAATSGWHPGRAWSGIARQVWAQNSAANAVSAHSICAGSLGARWACLLSRCSVAMSRPHRVSAMRALLSLTRRATMAHVIVRRNLVHCGGQRAWCLEGILSSGNCGRPAIPSWWWCRTVRWALISRPSGQLVRWRLAAQPSVPVGLPTQGIAGMAGEAARQLWLFHLEQARSAAHGQMIEQLWQFYAWPAQWRGSSICPGAV